MSEILTTDQAAARLALGRSTLEKWRCAGNGPKFIKLGLRRVGYHTVDLDEWIASRPRRASTSEIETQHGPGRPRKHAVAAT
jgi:predicted DNA-binding transcriptional regulator AlpA